MKGVCKFDICFKMSITWRSFDSGINAFTCVIHPCAMYIIIWTQPPSAPYVRLWTGSALDKVMACHLLGAKPLPQPMMTFCQLNPEDPTPMKSESKYKIFIHENEFENVVCEMTAIVSRSHCVNILFYLCPSNALRLPSMVVSCWGGSWEIMGICGKHRCVEYPLYHTHQRMLWFIGETSCDQEIPH